MINKIISAFPLAIGTSIAFESIFEGQNEPYDPKRVIPNKVKISSYNEMWINLDTLFRNIVGSITKQEFLTTNYEVLGNSIIQEILCIENILKNEGMNKCVPIFYSCKYKDIYTKLKPIYKLRTDNTNIQIFNEDMRQKTISFVNKVINQDNCIVVDNYLKPSSKSKCLILTHTPYDLLSVSNFSKLDLIESHTGKLKTRLDFYTKYYSIKGDNLNNIPFIEELLYIFGDHVMFHPLDINTRKKVIDLSKKYTWNAYTTKDRVIQCIKLSNIDIYSDLK